MPTSPSATVGRHPYADILLGADPVHARAVALWSERPLKEGLLVELGPDAGANGESTVIGVRDELAKGYPYVHILAHGAESGATEAPSFGLLLPGPRRYADEEEIDILTGDRFASILRSLPADKALPRAWCS